MLVKQLVGGPAGLEAVLRAEVALLEQLWVADLDAGGTLLLGGLPAVLCIAQLALCWQPQLRWDVGQGSGRRRFQSQNEPRVKEDRKD